MAKRAIFRLKDKKPYGQSEKLKIKTSSIQPVDTYAMQLMAIGH